MKRRAVRVSLHLIQAALDLEGGDLTDAFQDSQDRQQDTVSLILRSPGPSDPECSSVRYFGLDELDDEQDAKLQPSAWVVEERTWWQRFVDWWSW